jgi:hypothetical protein
MKTIIWSARVYVWISALAFLSVAYMAFSNPQSVMDLVQVQLPNNDARSSIRGVYGGVGFCLFGFLVFWSFRNLNMALSFLSFIWGGYVLSRAITLFLDGPLGDFGNQWIVIEFFFFLLGMFLWIWTGSRKSLTAI